MTMQTVTLGQLLPPKANPRKAVDAAAIEGLAASIKADGLLQNLVVRRRGRGRTYEIVSGERRYRALKLLEENGDLADDFAIPVDIRAGLKADDALRLATVENVQREQLNPMDEAEAFAALMCKGADVADVAARAGMSETTVKRRLALASLSGDVRELVRTGELSLSVAEAMTLGTPEQQHDILRRLEDGWHFDAEDIRHHLTHEKPSVAVAIFPLERYDGTYTTDLFGDEAATYFDDVQAFFHLQGEAVEELAEKHRQSAAWVEVVQAPYVAWWQYRDAEEDEASGVVIQYAPSGRVEVREGLVKNTVAESVAADTAETPVAPKPRPEYSGPMVRYIAAQKTLAVQAALLNEPRKAKEVAVVQMLGSVDGASRVRLDTHAALSLGAQMETTPDAYAAIEAEVAALLGLITAEPETESDLPAWQRLAYLHRSAVAVYEAVCALSDADLERLHLLLTVLTFGQGDIDRLDTGSSLFNRVAADLDVDMRQHWRPDATFLAGRRKDQLADIAAEAGAESRLGSGKQCTKTAYVAGLVRHFERCRGVGEDASADDVKGRDWLPGAMAFPARADAPEPDDGEAGQAVA